MALRMPARQPFSFPRRRFLQGLAGSVAFSGLSRLVGALPATVDIFEEIPPDVSGIRWVHTAGKSASKYLPETTGAGCAFLDYDNDGWMDIYLVNSGTSDFYTPSQPLRNALYRNNRDGTFTDVTEKAGVGAGGYGMGVAVGDYDGDGFPDLYVTQYGRSILYHNNGDGTFTDVTAKAGLGHTGMGLERGVVRLRQRWPAGSFRLPLCGVGQVDAVRHRQRRQTALLHSAHLPAHQQLAVSQQRRWDVYRR